MLHQAGAFFVTRAKSNIDAHRVYSAPTDRSTGIICDQTISLDGFYTRDYPDFCGASASRTPIRQTGLHHQQLLASGRHHLRAYKSRWQVESSGSSRSSVKQFYGTSENAVKTQIWIAVSVYVLVAIVKITLLQILSVTLFEKMLIHQALAGDENRCNGK